MSTHKKVFIIVVEEVPACDGDPAGFLATNDELGLVVEADSLDDLIQRVKDLAPTLFEMNVLPDLQESVQPAFNISHYLGLGQSGGLLPGFDCNFAA